jgi:4'-phosphopantetheinyl transferase
MSTATGLCLVNVYGVRLDRAEADIVSLRKLLSPREQERAERLRRGYRCRYTVCRAALRQILAARVKAAPQSLTFANGPHGKPELAGGPSFSVAHSGELALIAVSVGTLSLGVDIERIRPERRVSGLIGRFLSPSERQELECLSGERLVDAFHWCWTAKEAYLKALGVGLCVPLDSFDVSADLTAPAELLADRGSPIRCPWTLRRLHVDDKYAATLAVAAHAFEVHYERWTLGWESAAEITHCERSTDWTGS